MKPNPKLLAFLLGSCLIASVTPAKAAIYYWDSDSTTAGFGDTNGTWGSSDFWSTSSAGTGTATNATTTISDTVNFGTATLAYGTTPKTITLSGNRTVGSMVFGAAQTSAITFATTVGTNTITLASGGSVVVNAGNHIIQGTGTGTSGTSRDFIFSTLGASFNIAADSSFEINGRVGGGASNSNYTKTGAGTLILSGNNGGSGSWNFGAGGLFTISEGIVRFANTVAAGNSANPYTVASGAAMELSGGFSQTASNGNYTLNGTGIDDNGSLRSLSGNNSIVAALVSGLPPSGAIVLSTNSSIGVDADTLTIKKVISGSGSLTKVGAGTLVLNNTYGDNTTTYANTFTGNTTISAGILSLQGLDMLQNSAFDTGNSITGDATNGLRTNQTSLKLGGLIGDKNLANVFTTTTGGYSGVTAITLNAASGSNHSYSGVIDGARSLTKTGEGTQILTGNNTYTGATTISAGILQIGNNTTTGTLGNNSNTSIASGAELRIARSIDSFGYSYTGQLSGEGTVNIRPSRRFNFQTNNQTASGSLAFIVEGTLGINTGSGVTEVHLGELSGTGNIQRAGTAPVDAPLTTLTIGGKNTSSTYSGGISSTAEMAINKVGTGTLTLTGSTLVGGGTTVSAGTLLVNGTLGNTAAEVTVAAGAALGGTGTINGNLIFEEGSFLRILDINNPLILATTRTVTFGEGFGIAQLLGISWDDLALDTLHTLISTTQTFSASDIANFGFDNRVAVGTSGREAYFTTGSLALVVIPEPGAALLGGLGLLLLLRRRRS